jgi:rRNA maturation RNase YbeY
LSDEALWRMNVEHLNHDTYTDIITFVLNEPEETELLVDMYISVERVQENAKTLGIEFRNELHRVMVHGMLHAMGMTDKDPESEAAMREAEDLALSLREF